MKSAVRALLLIPWIPMVAVVITLLRFSQSHSFDDKVLAIGMLVVTMVWILAGTIVYHYYQSRGQEMDETQLGE